MTKRKPKTKQGYFIEWNGDYWQSVFPSRRSTESELHTPIADAVRYMTRESRVPLEKIAILPKVPT